METATTYGHNAKTYRAETGRDLLSDVLTWHLEGGKAEYVAVKAEFGLTGTATKRILRRLEDLPAEPVTARKPRAKAVKVPARKGYTVASSTGVVIAEVSHSDVTDRAQDMGELDAAHALIADLEADLAQARSQSKTANLKADKASRWATELKDAKATIRDLKAQVARLEDLKDVKARPRKRVAPVFDILTDAQLKAVYKSASPSALSSANPAGCTVRLPKLKDLPGVWQATGIHEGNEVAEARYFMEFPDSRLFVERAGVARNAKRLCLVPFDDEAKASIHSQAIVDIKSMEYAGKAFTFAKDAALV